MEPKGWKRAAAGALLLLAGCAGSERIAEVPEALRGEWTGEAHSVMAWSREPRVPVTIEVAGDGSVEGRLGGATLRHGYLARNRGELGRWLEIKSDYIVRGEVEGVVVPEEPHPSRVAFLPVDLVERDGAPALEGGLTTCRSDHGGGKDVAIAASGLVLRRKPR
jgi:hypothetical protein